MIKKIKKRLVRFLISYLRFRGKKIIHFLHIRKAGGSAIRGTFALGRSVFRNVFISDKFVFVMHGHDYTVVDVPDSDSFFFVIRDPIERMISGFYSRKRMGRPKNFNPWTDEERIAFEKYNTFEELLDSFVNGEKEAFNALQVIRHVNSSYWDWFINQEKLRDSSHKIFAVLVLENLNEDWVKLQMKVGDTLKNLPQNSKNRHSNPVGNKVNLTLPQKKVLKEYLKKEYEFMEQINEMKISLI